MTERASIHATMRAFATAAVLVFARMTFTCHARFATHGLSSCRASPAALAAVSSPTPGRCSSTR